MSKKNVHVVQRANGDWAALREGGKRASAVRPTQQKAIDVGRGIARREHGELIVHGENGRIRQKDSYGRDPFPPKG